MLSLCVRSGRRSTTSETKALRGWRNCPVMQTWLSSSGKRQTPANPAGGSVLDDESHLPPLSPPEVCMRKKSCPMFLLHPSTLASASLLAALRPRHHRTLPVGPALPLKRLMSTETFSLAAIHRGWLKEAEPKPNLSEIASLCA